MLKKIISVILVLTMAFSCFSMAIVVDARQVGVGGGAESFNPVEFSQDMSSIGKTNVNVKLVAKITDKNYQVKIKSINVALPFLEAGDESNLTVTYASGDVVTGETQYSVTGYIMESTNSVARYTIMYDILDKNGNTVWKNLTGYAYGAFSGSIERTGAIGTYPDDPGQVHSGAYFTSIDKLNSLYVQVSSAVLLYTLKTQHLFFTFNERTTETAVIEGNAPSTLRTYPVNWPSVMWWRQEAEGTWLMWSTPESGYYNFTLDMNATDASWDEETNTIVSTEMYYLDQWDRMNAEEIADKILGIDKAFMQGYYVQKGRYTEESWANLMSAMDMAQQVMLSVAAPNYGFKLACQNGTYADDNLINAFNNLQEAPCDWETYKDPIVGEGGSCGAGGSIIYTCICGKTKTESTSTDSCTPSSEWTVITPPTCTVAGVEAQLCIYCESIVNTREIEPLGHEYTTEVVPAGCYTQGYTIYTCIRGDHTYQDNYTPVRGHVHGYYEYKYPTAIFDGIKFSHCADCDIVISSEDIAKPEGTIVFSLQSNENTFFTTAMNLDTMGTTFYVPKKAVIDTTGIKTDLLVDEIPALGIENYKGNVLTYQGGTTAESGKEINFEEIFGGFTSADLSGRVITYNETNEETEYSFEYKLRTDDSKNDLYEITASPTDEEAAGVAMAELMSHIKSEKIRANDKLPEDEHMRDLITNQIKLPGTAYIQTGTTRLTLEDPNEIYTFSKVYERPTFVYEEAEATDAQVEIFLPVGTSFLIGNHRLTLEDFITLKLSGCDDNEVVNNFVDSLAGCQSADEKIEITTIFLAKLLNSVNGQQNVNLDIVINPAGYAVSGTVESFAPYEGADGTEMTSIALLQDGEIVDWVDVMGDGVQEFTFESVKSGTYTVEVIKFNHVVRAYDLVVEGDEITGLEYKIHLYGDIDGNGKLNVMDYSKVLRHVKKTQNLEGYELLCADVDENGKVNVMDYTAILRHVKKISSLW